MSFCVISLFFALKNFENLNYKNLFFFSLFAALATNIRVMGIFLFILFLTFLILDSIEENKFSKKKLYNLLVLLITFPLMVYFFWPFLWDDPVNKLIFTIVKSFCKNSWRRNKNKSNQYSKYFIIEPSMDYFVKEN